MKISDFADIYLGGTPSTKNSSYWNGDVAWITPRDMSHHGGVFIAKGERFITDEGVKKSGACYVPANTVILSTRAPVGYVAVAKNTLTTNQGCKNLMCRKGIADPIYVYYLLKHSTKKLQAHATGSTYTELSSSRLKKPDV